MSYDELILIGQKVDQVLANAVRLKMDKSKISPLGIKQPDEVYDFIMKGSPEGGSTIVYAIGNMGAGGLQVVKYFKKQSETVEELVS